MWLLLCDFRSEDSMQSKHSLYRASNSNVNLMTPNTISKPVDFGVASHSVGNPLSQMPRLSEPLLELNSKMEAQKTSVGKDISEEMGIALSPRADGEHFCVYCFVFRSNVMLLQINCSVSPSTNQWSEAGA